MVRNESRTGLSLERGSAVRVTLFPALKPVAVASRPCHAVAALRAA